MMTIFDPIRTEAAALLAAVDVAEKADNAEFDAWQAALTAAKAQANVDAATIADLKAQIDVLTHPQPPAAAIRWGSSVFPIGGEPYPTALARVEKAFTPDLLRIFIPGIGGPAWPTQTGQHPLVLSFKLPPAEVVAGQHDAQLVAFFAATPAMYTAAQPARISYWHEPENDGLDPVAYRAAWAHIAAIARASGKPVRLTLILMEFSLHAASNRNWKDWYQADAVDVLGWDCYWRPGRFPADVYASARTVSAAAGKPWAVCETAASATEAPPPQRQQLLHDMAHDLATTKPLPEFVTYFDSDPGPGFHWRISDDPAAAAAWMTGRTA